MYDFSKNVLIIINIWSDTMSYCKITAILHEDRKINLRKSQKKRTKLNNLFKSEQGAPNKFPPRFLNN